MSNDMDDPQKFIDSVKEIKKSCKDFSDYILKCFDYYKALDNESWRNEFEDIHTIEFFSLAFVNIWNDCPAFLDNKNKKELTDIQKKKLTVDYFEMAKILLESKNLDNIYLIKRAYAMCLPGFYDNYSELEEARIRLCKINDDVFQDEKLKKDALTYKVKKIKEFKK